jgi:hypothetical protein
LYGTNPDKVKRQVNLKFYKTIYNLVSRLAQEEKEAVTLVNVNEHTRKVKEIMREKLVSALCEILKEALIFLY